MEHFDFTEVNCILCVTTVPSRDGIYLPSLATRLYSVFTLLYINAPILHRDLWPNVGHLVHTTATRGKAELMLTPKPRQKYSETFVM